MTDVATQKPLYVSTGGTAGPYIILSVNQLDEVRRILDDNQIGYWVEENVISLNGGPEIAVMNFGRGGNATAIQALLDSSG